MNMKAWHSQVKSGGAANVGSRTCYWVKLSLLSGELHIGNGMKNLFLVFLLGVSGSLQTFSYTD